MSIMRKASSRTVRQPELATTLRDNHPTVEPAAPGRDAEPHTLTRHPAKARYTRSHVMVGTFGISYPGPDQLGRGRLRRRGRGEHRQRSPICPVPAKREARSGSGPPERTQRTLG